mmetsp:Transcript_40710/g.62139  ORF Transcript_40710/g.62139 Transcript_40710/m.62139 type:complete len:101 (-) Transcript_40710:444-746(-)
MAMTIFGKISGGHFNPAVTAGLFAKRTVSKWLQTRKKFKFDFREFKFALLIILAQVIGGFIGMAIVPFAMKFKSAQNAIFDGVEPKIYVLCPLSNSETAS